MSSIESQLLEYRTRKARERKKEIHQPRTEAAAPARSSSQSWIPGTSSIMGVLDYFRGGSDYKPVPYQQSCNDDNGSNTNQKIGHQVHSPDEEDDKLITQNCITACSTESSTKQKIIAALPPVLKFILWTVLWALFIEIGFGAVYFVISLLIIMWYSMRTRPKKSGEMSAYSVFNPGQEKIDGTFTAEQFERELRYGAAAVH